MAFRILARSNIKDSMTFLIAEPPLRRADRQRCQGDIKLTRVHHGFLRAGALGGEAHLGIPYPQIAERSTAVAAISMVTAGVEARSWTRSRGTTSLPRAGRWSCTDTVRPDIKLVNAGSRSRAPAADQERGDEQRGSRQQGRVPPASARRRRTRGPRAPGVASSQTFRTGGSVHGTTRARLRGAPRDQPLAYASGPRADTSCRPT